MRLYNIILFDVKYHVFTTHREPVESHTRLVNLNGMEGFCYHLANLFLQTKTKNTIIPASNIQSPTLLLKGRTSHNHGRFDSAVNGTQTLLACSLPATGMNPPFDSVAAALLMFPRKNNTTALFRVYNHQNVQKVNVEIQNNIHVVMLGSLSHLFLETMPNPSRTSVNTPYIPFVILSASFCDVLAASRTRVGALLDSTSASSASATHVRRAETSFRGVCSS